MSLENTPPPLAWLDEELGQLDLQGLRRTLATYTASQGVQVVLDGRELLNFGSNDYLQLAADPHLTEAVSAALAATGWGSGASPLVCGHAALHAELERQLAEFEGQPAALLFSSGFAANLGVIAALVGRGDAVFGDQKNHASIIDGCRLSRAEVFIYRHNDVEHLAELLQAAAGRFRRRLIVTDTLFSMDGDLAPLEELADLADRYGAMLMVDEAHATGVFGPHGRGVAEHLGVEERIAIRIGTLSKALGCAGGFVAGSQALIDWLANRARSYVFSTAQPAAASAAALAALGIVRDEPHRRRELLERAAALRARLQSQGWRTGDSASQIIPLYLGTAERAMRLTTQLRAHGLFVPGIRPPSVPEGESLLRISLSWGHTPAMLDQLVAALGREGERIGE